MSDAAAPALAPSVVPEEAPPAAPAWSPALRMVYRFVFCYLVLYSAPDGERVSLINALPGLEDSAGFYGKIWRAIVPWVAIHVFHLSGKAVTYFPTGSGDTTLAYVHNFCMVVLAVAVTLVWSLLDRRRKDYRALDGWLRILVRYTLAVTMFGYGFAKVFPQQFQFPRFVKMIEPFGEFSPMGVLWTFMGSSPAYTIFTGMVEVSGGLLLLFRRTTLLGAMVTAAAVLNIVLLNFCYDVPVKLYSTNLLLMAIYLLAPDLKRLAGMLVLNRNVPPADLGRLPFTRRWLQWTAVGIKVAFIGVALYGQVSGGWKAYQKSKNPDRPPLYGLYEVDKFSKNGVEVPALTTEKTRWRKVAVQFPNFLTIRMMDDSLSGYQTEYAKAGDDVTLWQQTKDPNSHLRFTRPDDDHVQLSGAIGSDTLSIGLRKIDVSKFLLVSRGFHWINELPFNR